MGVYYKGGSPKYRSIGDNLAVMSDSFNYKDGYFGNQGKSHRVRIINDDDPMVKGKNFYDKLSFGGIEKDLSNGKGKITYMADGSIITFRPITKSDSYPAVDINILHSIDSKGIKQQKVHFGKRDDKL